MAKLKFEYTWLDGYTPEPNMRSNTKILEMDFFDGNIAAVSFSGNSFF